MMLLNEKKDIQWKKNRGTQSEKEIDCINFLHDGAGHRHHDLLSVF